MEIEKELWLPVKGYENFYEVSNEGNVRNKKTKYVLTPKVNNAGYCAVKLCKLGTNRLLQVSRIVATAWIPNPDNLPEVDHLDRNPFNNRVDNLEWVSREENIRRRKGHSNKKATENKRNARPVEQLKDGKVIAWYPTLAEASRKTGINAAAIWKVCEKQLGRRTTGGFGWRDAVTEE